MKFSNNLDTIAISWVRVKSREVIEYVKEYREKRPMSSMHSAGLNGRKTYGSKTTLKTRKSDAKTAAIDSTITTRKVRKFNLFLEHNSTKKTRIGGSTKNGCQIFDNQFIYWV